MFRHHTKFLPVARMTLTQAKDRIDVEIIDPVAAALDEAVYAWLTPGYEPLRIGTSKVAVGRRLRSYRGYINKRLAGGESSTPAWEAAAWLNLLLEHDHLLAVVFQPRLIRTIAGLIRPYLDIEREMIRRHRPQLNRSYR